MTIHRVHPGDCHYSGRMPAVTTRVVCQLSLLGSYANCHYSGRMPTVTTRVVCQLSLLGSYANCHYSGRMPTVTTRVVCQLSLLGLYATLLKKGPSGCYATTPPTPHPQAFPLTLLSLLHYTVIHWPPPQEA